MGLLDSFFGGGTDDQTTLFFATDLHGSEKCFKKFVNAKAFYDADVLVLGGDLTGKAIVPIIDEGEGWRAEYPNQTKHLNGPEEVAAVEGQVRNAGNYPYRLDAAEYERFRGDDDRVREVYERLEAERLAEWVAFAEEKREPDDPPIYAIGGNDDEAYVTDHLTDSDAFALIDGADATLPTGHEILGYGWSNPTPWDTPREKPEDGIETELRRIAREVDAIERTILNVHCPPYDTTIDEAPTLDENLHPVTQGGQVVDEPVGSTAVRSFVEDEGPLLGLHGHIHESRGEFDLEGTICLNPGSQYGEGVLNGAIVTLAPEEVVQTQLISG